MFINFINAQRWMLCKKWDQITVAHSTVLWIRIQFACDLIQRELKRPTEKKKNDISKILTWKSFSVGHSVADPGCLSCIPDPDFYPSRIPDLGFRIQKQQQKRGVKKNCYIFTQKMWLWDPGSEIRNPGSETRESGSGKNLFRIADPGVKKAPDLGRIQGSKKHRIPHPQHCFWACPAYEFLGCSFAYSYPGSGAWKSRSWMNFPDHFPVSLETVLRVKINVADPWHFGVDPDPRIHASDLWIRIRIRIRILLYSSLTFKMSAKK